MKHTILSGKHFQKLLINISKFTLAVSSGKFCRFIEFLCVAVSFIKQAEIWRSGGGISLKEIQRN